MFFYIPLVKATSQCCNVLLHSPCKSYFSMLQRLFMKRSLVVLVIPKTNTLPPPPHTHTHIPTATPSSKSPALLGLNCYMILEGLKISVVGNLLPHRKNFFFTSVFALLNRNCSFENALCITIIL